MSDDPTACPTGGSAEVHLRRSHGEWVRDGFVHEWTPGMAPKGPTQLRLGLFRDGRTPSIQVHLPLAVTDELA
jgi:hypothetical protein